MKKSELVNLIQNIVNNDLKIIKKSIKLEVKKQINEIFIKEGVISSVLNQKTKNNSVSGLVEKNKSISMSKKKNITKPKTSTHYSKNPILNKILNETAGGIENEYIKEVGDEYPTMMNKIFTTEDANLLAPNGVMNDDTKLKVGAVQTIKSVPGASVDSVPETVLHNLSRNYKDVLEKSIQISKRSKG